MQVAAFADAALRIAHRHHGQVAIQKCALEVIARSANGQVDAKDVHEIAEDIARTAECNSVEVGLHKLEDLVAQGELV